MNFFYISFTILTLIVLTFVFYQVQFYLLFTPTYKRREDLDDEFEFLSIDTKDGVKLEGIVYTPKKSQSTLLFFGGRSHDVVGIIPKLAKAYPTFTIVSFNYRSYGKSEGKVNEENIFHDALEVLKKVKKHYGETYVLGYSLGSSIASYVASKEEIKALFLISPFDSLAKLTMFLPRYKFNNMEFVEHIEAKTYIYATKIDRLVPLKNTINLVKYVKNLVSLKEYENLTHAEILWHVELINDINKEIK